MSWLRYSDAFADDRAWDGVSYEARWHYLALVQTCSRSRRFDGVLGEAQAMRASDVPDPAKALGELCAAGWVERRTEGFLVTAIDAHVPPPHLRDEAKLPKDAAKSAAYRQRRCAAGQHSRYCPPATCPVKLERPVEASPSVSPVQSRPGVTGDTADWPEVAPIPEPDPCCDMCGQRLLLIRPGRTRCSRCEPVMQAA